MQEQTTVTAQSDPAAGDHAHDRQPSYHKATGDVIGYADITPADALPDIVAAARAAQEKWALIPVKERAKMMREASRFITEHADQLAETISRDNGKTRVDALVTELLPAAMGASFYAGKARKFLKDRWLMPGHPLLANKVSRIVRVPFGVIGIISPWNYPFAIPFSEVVMGLLAGNAVVLKTASETQMVGLALKTVFESIGLPRDIFHYVNMPGRIAGDAFLESGMDKLFFTGSVPVGKYLMKKASETLTPVSLELGGNDAMLVCEDADIQRAVDGAIWAGFQNAGQSCGGVERIYVHEAVYETFVSLLKERTERLRVGFDTDFQTDIGVMTTQRQTERVAAHIEDALNNGATLYAKAEKTGGASWQHLMEPVVLTDVTHEMRVMREETFGPVVGVMKVADMDQAVLLANDSDLGLTGSVWTRNLTAGTALARRIRAGAVLINDHLMSHGLAETPWGGFKESGIGRTHGDIGFQEMTEPQVIVVDWLPFARRSMWWHPHSKSLYNGIRGLLRLLYGKGVFQRMRGGMALVPVFMRTFTRQR